MSSVAWILRVDRRHLERKFPMPTRDSQEFPSLLERHISTQATFGFDDVLGPANLGWALSRSIIDEHQRIVTVYLP